jgi:hypothetical protein
MQYPHWLMVAGGLLVILGFAGLAFRKSSPEPADEDAAPEAQPELRTRPGVIASGRGVLG